MSPLSSLPDCQIIKMERPKPNTFLIRGLQYTTVVERMFYADSKEEREEWIKAIESIAEQLQVLDEASKMDDDDAAVADTKGKKKVVSLQILVFFEFLLS